MTLPRQVLPDSTYLVTRRCAAGRFFLRPSRTTNEIFAYCVAYAADRTGVVLVALTVMSNHWHAVVHDPLARLPEFLACAHKLVAKCINAELGRAENMWSSDRPSVVRLESTEDVLDKVAYTAANPVIAALVESPADWPGLCMLPGQRCQTQRPQRFFREDGLMPNQVALELQFPPLLAAMGTERAASAVASAVQGRVRKARADAKRAGRRFIGAAAVERQRTTKRCQRPAADKSRRAIKPQVAALDVQKRLTAIARLRAFAAAYREAFGKWSQGMRDVLFPPGTYSLRVRAGVACAPP